jgi:hypothetical protein
VTRITSPVGLAKPSGSGGNLHCLLVFRSDVAEEDLAQFEYDPTSAAQDGEDDADELAEDVDAD